MKLEYKTFGDFIHDLPSMNYGTIDKENYMLQMHRRIELLPFTPTAVITSSNPINSILYKLLNTCLFSGTNGWLSRHCIGRFCVDKKRRIFLELDTDAVQIILTFN